VIEKILDFLETKNIKYPKKDKFNLLSTIKAMAKKNGQEIKAIENKLISFKKRGRLEDKLKIRKLNNVKKAIERGRPFSEALFNAGIITPREYHILKTTKGDNISSGIEKILETQTNSSKVVGGFVLMLAPPGVILVALLWTQPLVFQILNDMLSPIVSAGGTPPPIKPYLSDRTYYIFLNFIYFLIIGVAMSAYILGKKIFPKKFFKYAPPIIQQELVLNILKSIKTVSEGGGINLSNTAKALVNGEEDNIKKQIFQKIVERTSRGKQHLSDVLEEFNVDYDVIGNIKVGEESNDLGEGLDIAIDDLETKYNRNISLFLKTSMWIGQLSMIFIAMKPMIDIMLLMSIGQLDFKV
jgi:type II secretory pathway component PulF